MDRGAMSRQGKEWVLLLVVNISDDEFLLKSRAKIYQASLFLLIIIIMNYVLHNNYYKKEK